MASIKTQPALLGGAFIGVLSALPVVSAGNCCCLWLVGGGAIAAYLVQQSQAEPITAGDGAGSGFLAGILGAFVYVVVAAPIQILTGPMQRRMMERVLESAETVPPEWRGMLENAGSGMAGLVIGFFVMLALGMIFATLGGLLGAIIFRRDTPPAPGTAETSPHP